MRDQLEVYKKLRQNHQREVLILESKLQAEMNEHRRTLDKEYDSQVHIIDWKTGKKGMDLVVVIKSWQPSSIASNCSDN